MHRRRIRKQHQNQDDHQTEGSAKLKRDGNFSKRNKNGTKNENPRTTTTTTATFSKNIKKAIDSELLFNSTNSYEEYIIQRRKEFVWKRSITKRSITFMKIWISISSVGVVYLAFIGKLIQLQPLFISGLLRKSKHNQDQGDLDQEYTISNTSFNAFAAAKAYAATIILCLLFIRYHIHLISFFSRRRNLDKTGSNLFFSENVNLFEKGKIEYGTFESKKSDAETVLPFMNEKNKRG